jgi:membrane protein YdbS with pleckstrin-like domain
MVGMTDQPANRADPFDPAGLTWHPAQPALRTVRLIGNGIAAALILVAGLVCWFIWQQVWILIVAGVLLALGVPQFILIPRRVRAIGWAVRDRDLFFRHGVLSRELAVVPYTRVQFVDLTAGPIDRAFGLTTLEVNTAANEDVTIPGLSPAEAAELREILTDKTKLDPVG